MQFLLIDASLARDSEGNILDPDRPSDANGSTINELGDGTTLSIFDSDADNLRTESRDLPPYDVQFVPGVDNVESVVFVVTNKTTGDSLTVIDNFAPYAVSKAVDGFFKQEMILETEGEIEITARAYSRDLYIDEADYDPEDPEIKQFEKVEFALTDLEVTNSESQPTDFNNQGREGSAEVEAEAETAVQLAPGKALGGLALAASAAAVRADSATQALTSGSVSLKAPGRRLGTAPAPGGITEVAGGPTAGPIAAPTPITARVNPSAEGSAEVEVESEAEVSAESGTAAAVAGSAVAASAAGVSAYLDSGGDTAARTTATQIAVDAASSTSTSVSRVDLDGGVSAESESAPQAQDASAAPQRSATAAPAAGDEKQVFILQLDTESEVEVEVEAEAEAAVGDGAAAAAATGGVGVAVAGDFAAPAAYASVATSTASDRVSEKEPEIFAILRQEKEDGLPEEPFIDRCQDGRDPGTYAPSAPPRPGSSGDTVGVEQGLSPLAPSSTSSVTAAGRGFFEAEAEAEGEAEISTEVGNGAAAAAAIAIGGAGSAGFAATSRVAAATSASTTVRGKKGVETRANDQGEIASDRAGGTPTFERNQAALAGAELVDGDPFPPEVESAATCGDAGAIARTQIDGAAVQGQRDVGTTAIGPRDLQAQGRRRTHARRHPGARRRP